MLKSSVDRHDDDVFVSLSVFESPPLPVLILTCVGPCEKRKVVFSDVTFNF